MGKSNIETTKILKKLGFAEDTYLETVTLFGGSTMQNFMWVTPLGVKLRESEEMLYARLFRGSRAFELVSSGVVVGGVICVTEQPEVFFWALFDKQKLINRFKSSHCPRSICDACVEFTIAGTSAAPEYVQVLMKPVGIRFARRIPRGLTRMRGAIVEALVWLTKMPHISGDERAMVLKGLDLLREAVYRSTENEFYREIIDDVISRIKAYTSSSSTSSM